MTARHRPAIGRIFLSLLLALAIAAPMAACGKRGKLETPPADPGDKADYPRKYPRE